MIYDNFKRKLIDEIERTKNKIMVDVNTQGSKFEPLFMIRTDEDKIYAKIIESIKEVSERECGILLNDLFSLHGIQCQMDTHVHLGPSSVAFFDLLITNNGEKEFIELRTQPEFNDNLVMEQLSNYVKQAKIKGYLVYLVKENVDSEEAAETLYMQMKESGVDKVEVYLFEEFLEKMFGKDERKSFQKSMKTFKEEMHKAIGYQLTEFCTPQNMEKLKETLKVEIPAFDYEKIAKIQYDKITSDMNEIEMQVTGITDVDENTVEKIGYLENASGFSESDYETIKKFYIQDKRYELLLGESDFANSFLTSEWLYRKYTIAEELDNTYVVAGYMKSIEQLLWGIVHTVGMGKSYHKYKNSSRNVTVTEENIISMTLGQLRYFIKDNGEILMESFGSCGGHVVSFLFYQLEDWTDNERNGYFHKHNLHNVEKVETIKDETYFLYFLILGSVQLSPDDLRILS